MKAQSNNLTRTIQLFLLLLNIGMGVYLFMESKADLSGSENNIAINFDAKDMISVTGNKKEFPLINIYQDILDRPLFMEDRQPYVLLVPKIETNIKGINSSQLSLSAVVITSEKNIAILQYAKSKILQRIALGETIDGWTLTEVHDQHVVLKKGDNIKTLILEIKGSLQRKMPEKARNVGG
jgi:hypothetical protein